MSADAQIGDDKKHTHSFDARFCLGRSVFAISVGRERLVFIHNSARTAHVCGNTGEIM